MAVTLEHYLVVSVSLFVLGLFIVMTRRNGIRILMGVELILNAANLNLIAFNRFLPGTGMDGNIFAIFVIILAAAEAAVALAIVLAIYQQFSTIHLEEISSMKH
jgi:NADH:ubiquinone oxidoreductase subunit K